MKLYVGNLPFSVGYEELKKIFEGFDLEDALVIADKFNGRSKGFGFVTIANDESAKKAISKLNDKEIDGRKIKVNEARPKEERSRE